MVRVVKRDGRREEFIPEKVVVSAIKSGAPPTYARQIAKEVEGEVKEDTTTKEIREMALNRLRNRNEDWAKNWLLYDRAVKRIPK